MAKDLLEQSFSYRLQLDRSFDIENRAQLLIFKRMPNVDIYVDIFAVADE